MMRIRAIFAVISVIALSVLCRATSAPQEQERTQFGQSLEPSIVIEAAPNIRSNIPELAPIASEDCDEFRELVLLGDRTSMEAYLACID